MQNKIPPSTAEPSFTVAEAKGTTTTTTAATTTATTTTTTLAATFDERQWEQLNELAAPQTNQKTNLTKYRVQNSRGRTRLRLIVYTIAITVLLQQLQQHNGTMAAKLTNSITATATAAVRLPSLTAASAAAATSSLTPTVHQSRHRKSRLRKRTQRSVFEIYRNEMSSHDIEWSHPCHGNWMEKLAKETNNRAREEQRQKHNRGKRCLEYKKLLRKMKEGFRPECNELRRNFAIDIRPAEMKMWSLHNSSYTFLPSARSKTHISLSRWQRAMQTFVAAFSYMRRAQLHWDAHNGMQESETSVELRKLKKSAQRSLCNVESTYNQTNLIHVYGKKSPQTEGIDIISRPAMEARLVAFQTPILQLQNSTAVLDSNLFDKTIIALDIKFLKLKYFEYLLHIKTVLRKNLPGLCLKASAKKQKRRRPNA